MCEKKRHRNGREERTHCPQGHEYTEENTYYNKNNNEYKKRNTGRRACRTCVAAATKAWREKNLEREREKARAKHREKLASREKELQSEQAI